MVSYSWQIKGTPLSLLLLKIRSTLVPSLVSQEKGCSASLCEWDWCLRILCCFMPTLCQPAVPVARGMISSSCPSFCPWRTLTGKEHLWEFWNEHELDDEHDWAAEWAGSTVATRMHGHTFVHIEHILIEIYYFSTNKWKWQKRVKVGGGNHEVLDDTIWFWINESINRALTDARLIDELNVALIELYLQCFSDNTDITVDANPRQKMPWLWSSLFPTVLAALLTCLWWLSYFEQPFFFLSYSKSRC